MALGQPSARGISDPAMDFTGISANSISMIALHSSYFPLPILFAASLGEEAARAKRVFDMPRPHATQTLVAISGSAQSRFK